MFDMTYDISKFKRVPLSTLREVLRACAIHSSADTNAIARACGVSPTTVSKAMLVLHEFGLVEGDASGWTCSGSNVDRSSGDGAVDGVIKDALLAYRPFESVCEGLIAGECFQQAGRHAAVMFDFDARGEQNVELLHQWGVELGILNDDDPATLNADLMQAVESLAATPVGDVTSAAETRLYVSTVLGRVAFDELDEIDRGLLSTAVMECDINPAASVEASGQALEDQLRELCIAKGLSLEARKMNGAGQLAGLLRQHDVIHPHHMKLVDSASMLRNAKAHKKDKQTVTPWSISPLGARTAFGTTALALRSIHDWVSKGRQTL
jgi:hypothetical protein